MLARMRIVLLFIVAASLSGCVAAKPILRTVADAAHVICGQYFSEKQRLSFEDAAREFCSTEEQLRPFLEEILRAKQRAKYRLEPRPNAGKVTTIYLERHASP
jgi:hypothetical protein